VVEVFSQVVYRECNFESGKKYSFVQIQCIPSGILTYGGRQFIATSCSLGDMYWPWPWLCLRLGVLSKMFITFTLLHPGLDRLPLISFLSLHPYGIAVPSFRIQYSSFCLRSGARKLGFLLGWYIFSRMRTFIERLECSGCLKWW
jgi:hypothetical protein